MIKSLNVVNKKNKFKDDIVSVVYEDVKRFCDEVSKTDQDNVLTVLFQQFDAPQSDIIGWFNQWREETAPESNASIQISDNLINQLNAEINHAVSSAVSKQQAQITHGKQIERHLAGEIEQLQQALKSANEKVEQISQTLTDTEQQFSSKIDAIEKSQQEHLNQLQSEHELALTNVQEEHKAIMSNFVRDRDEKVTSLKQELKNSF